MYPNLGQRPSMKWPITTCLPFLVTSSTPAHVCYSAHHGDYTGIIQDSISAQEQYKEAVKQTDPLLASLQSEKVSHGLASQQNWSTVSAIRSRGITPISEQDLSNRQVLAMGNSICQCTRKLSHHFADRQRWHQDVHVISHNVTEEARRIKTWERVLLILPP